MNDLVHTLLRYAAVAALIVACFWFFKTQAKVVIDSDDISMDPTVFPPGRYSLDFSAATPEQLKAGDVVAYYLPGESEKPRVARIMALPGQKVAIEARALTVDQQAVPSYKVEGDPRVPEIRIPLGAFYLLADRSAMTSDSLKVGPVPFSQILGRIKP